MRPSKNGRLPDLRYESGNNSRLEHLYEFNACEIIFFGSEEFASEKRASAMPLIRKLAETMDIQMSLQSATDPFFSTASAAKAFSQQTHDVTSEVLLATLTENMHATLMVGGSENLHGSSFVKRFDISPEDGAPAHTGCIGLGIERRVIAAFTHNGFENRGCPVRITNEKSHI